MNALISAEELLALLDKPGVRLLDASYGQPPAGIRIDHAQDFDIDAVADRKAALPHTLPSPEDFAVHAGALGISNGDHVIVYDRAGVAMAAARAWWMFRIFGHEKIQILDGGLPAWLAKGYPVHPKTGGKAPQTAAYKASYLARLFKDRQDILGNLDRQDFTVLDARDAKRYSGEAPEPRPGVAGGHIPGSLSVPYAALINPETGLFRENKELEECLRHVDRARPLAVSCGSGVTACVVALALHRLGRDDVAVYDGSWAEWGGDASLPRKKGNAP